MSNVRGCVFSSRLSVCQIKTIGSGRVKSETNRKSGRSERNESTTSSSARLRQRVQEKSDSVQWLAIEAKFDTMFRLRLPCESSKERGILKKPPREGIRQRYIRKNKSFSPYDVRNVPFRKKKLRKASNLPDFLLCKLLDINSIYILLMKLIK